MKLKKIVLATCILGIVGANAADSNSAKHYGFSAVFGFTSETLIHKNFTSLNDIERVSYATILGSTPGLIKELTDEEIAVIGDKCFGTMSYELWVQTNEFARAILRKAQEK